MAFFERGGSLSANISGERGQFPATPVGVERLEISLFRTVLKIEILTDDYFVLSQYMHLTDGQMDRTARAIPCVALHAVAWQKLTL